LEKANPKTELVCSFQFWSLIFISILPYLIFKHMPKQKLYSILIWSFTILAFIFFFFSLRSNENGMEYSAVALGLWGIAFLLNRFKPS